jgi:hypothetical protein
MNLDDVDLLGRSSEWQAARLDGLRKSIQELENLGSHAGRASPSRRRHIRIPFSAIAVAFVVAFFVAATPLVRSMVDPSRLTATRKPNVEHHAPGFSVATGTPSSGACPSATGAAEPPTPEQIETVKGLESTMGREMRETTQAMAAQYRNEEQHCISFNTPPNRTVLCRNSAAQHAATQHSTLAAALQRSTALNCNFSGCTVADRRHDRPRRVLPNAADVLPTDAPAVLG